MTKVNLLPDYIWEGKRIRQTAMLVAGAVVLELLLIGFLYTQKTAALTEAQSEMETQKALADKVDQINSQAEGITATIKPITDKTDYIRLILQHDQKFPRLFERTNMYTYYKVGYRDLQPAGTVLNMTANAKSVSDIGRYLLNIQRARDTFTTVSITSQMPGWPSAASGGTTAPTPVATNPYSAMSVTSGVPGAPAYGGYPGGGGVLGGLPTATATPTLLDFTAVGALTEKYSTVPPVFAGAAGTDATGATGTTGGYGYPGSSAYGGYPTPGGPAGGGANGGGANGGS